MINQSSQADQIPIDQLLNDPEAAKVLGTTTASLKQSRYSGLLFGKPTPKFLKMGKSAKYRLSTLVAFVNQFPEFQNTSEYKGSGKSAP